MIDQLPTIFSWAKRFYRRLDEYEQQTGRQGASEPEFRLPQSILGAVLVVIGLFWFGFTTWESSRDEQATCHG
jgi:hypothetical protein